MQVSQDERQPVGRARKSRPVETWKQDRAIARLCKYELGQAECEL